MGYVEGYLGDGFVDGLDEVVKFKKVDLCVSKCIKGN